MADDPRPGESEGPPSKKSRVLLCVVDETEEVNVALEFAALRAKRQKGRVALVYVIDPPTGYQHWATVADLMKEEARDEAEQKLQRAAAYVQRWSGSYPIFYVREGPPAEEIVKLIQEEPDISILVLGAAVGPQGPGPLVSTLAGKMVGRLRVPLVVVPGNLSDEQLDLLA